MMLGIKQEEGSTATHSLRFFIVYTLIVHRGYIPNYKCISPKLTELLAEIVKLPHYLTNSLTLLILEGHIQIKPFITIFEIVFREAKHQI